MTKKEFASLKRKLDDPNFKPGWLTKAKIVSLVNALERERRKNKKLQERIDVKYKQGLNTTAHMYGRGY